MVILFSQLCYLWSWNDFAWHQQVYLLYLSQPQVLHSSPDYKRYKNSRSCRIIVLATGCGLLGMAPGGGMGMVLGFGACMQIG